ncbi:MAG: glycosyltransferase family 1 protein [Acidobacteria bacterium]|nr:MAG: glycosyltransferase family 1 protein [Acidobacteriota bacterium]
MKQVSSLNLLTFNRHTGYLYNLSKIGHQWIVLGDWQNWNRPLPENFRLAKWEIARRDFAQFDAVIGHDIRHDLWMFLPYCLCYHKPYIQVIHGRRARGGFSRSRVRKFAKQLYSNIILRPLINLGLMRVVFISPYARSDWGLDGTTIDQGIPLDEMKAYEGIETSLLIVGNTLHREHFAFDELMQIQKQVPVSIVGVNPDIPGCCPSRNWDELRSFYSRNRAYLNLTREPEAGHNLALLEAMASGMPAISLEHPSTPIKNGENGFLVENVSEAVDRAKQLLADRELAQRLGRCARDTIERKFSLNVFQERWNELLARTAGSALTPDDA